jgi:hypothetical protein
MGTAESPNSEAILGWMRAGIGSKFRPGIRAGILVPTIGFREFSPPVPREILAHLQTGDRPAALADNAHPIARLLRRHCKKQQTTLPGIANAVCVTQGQKLLPEWIAKIKAHLAIPKEETSTARDQTIA